MRLAQFFCTSTSQDLSVSFHLSALMTTSRSHRAASTLHSTGRAEFLLLGTIVKIATKLINLKQKSLSDLYQQAISKKSRGIINDPTYPLHSCYEIMPSGKRYRTPAFKRKLYNKSFIPSAVRFLNSQKNL